MSRILISAGEPSGDRYAAQVAATLMDGPAPLEIDAIGGPALEATGAAIIGDLSTLSAVGLVEAAGTLPAHLRLLGAVDRRLRQGRYAAAVLVDYPGFHLRVARRAAKYRVPVLYYVAPQLWAWAAWRARGMRRTVHELAVVLPFEESFFRRHAIPARFVGHPLLDRPQPPGQAAARRLLALGRGPMLALFPGSRTGDVARHWPLFRDTARQLRQSVPELSVVVAGVAGSAYPGSDDVSLWRGDPGVVMAAADAALVKSGTATLEAALAGLPMVTTYRMHPVTYAVARRLVRVPHVSLVNLVAGRRIIPELLQDRATPAVLAAALAPLLDRDGGAASAQRAGFREVRARLGAPGAARRVAARVRTMVA